MSDEPYAFGPTDPRTPAVPTSRPDSSDSTEPRAWGAGPDAQPTVPPAAGSPGSSLPHAGTAPYANGSPYANGAQFANGGQYANGGPADGGRSTGAVGDSPALNGAAPWGARPAAEGRKRMSTMAKSLTAVGVAAVIAVGGTVAVTSANADNSTSPASSAMQPMGGGEGSTGTGGMGGTGTGGTGTSGTGGTGRFGGGMASRSLLAGALHGEFVVADGTGTVTERLQTGSISSISSISVTVKSTDAFTATYVIPTGIDVSSLATGTTVTVIAKVEGSTVTVVSITVAMQGGVGGSGSGGFTPPDGSGTPGSGGFGSGNSGSGSSGTGTGSTGPGGTGTGGTGTGGTGALPGGTAPGGSTNSTTGDDSGV